MILKRKWALILVLGLAAIVLILLVFRASYHGDDFDSRNSETITRVEGILFASEEYFAVYGKWPSNLGTLVTNRRWAHLATNDAWGYVFHYVPHDSGRGYGVVITLGPDNKPGGLGTNADGVGFFGGKNYPQSLAEIEDWLEMSSK